MNNEIKDNKSTKKKKLVLILLILLILLSIGGFLGFKWYENNKIQSQEGQLTGTIGTIPGLSPEKLQKELQKKADESLFSFNINSKPVFENGKSEGNLRIANPQYNVYPIEVTISGSIRKMRIYNIKSIFPAYTNGLQTFYIFNVLCNSVDSSLFKLKVYSPNIFTCSHPKGEI